MDIYEFLGVPSGTTVFDMTDQQKRLITDYMRVTGEVSPDDIDRFLSEATGETPNIGSTMSNPEVGLSGLAQPDVGYVPPDLAMPNLPTGSEMSSGISPHFSDAGMPPQPVQTVPRFSGPNVPSSGLSPHFEFGGTVAPPAPPPTPYMPEVFMDPLPENDPFDEIYTGVGPDDFQYQSDPDRTPIEEEKPDSTLNNPGTGTVVTSTRSDPTDPMDTGMGGDNLWEGVFGEEGGGWGRIKENWKNMSPEKKDRLYQSLIAMGGTMMSTPGNFGEGFGAGALAGLDTYTGAEQQDFDNEMKVNRYNMDARKADLAYDAALMEYQLAVEEAQRIKDPNSTEALTARANQMLALERLKAYERGDWNFGKKASDLEDDQRFAALEQHFRTAFTPEQLMARYGTRDPVEAARIIFAGASAGKLPGGSDWGGTGDSRPSLESLR